MAGVMEVASSAVGFGVLASDLDTIGRRHVAGDVSSLGELEYKVKEGGRKELGIRSHRGSRLM